MSTHIIQLIFLVVQFNRFVFHLRLAPKARGLALSVQDIPGVSMARNTNPMQYDVDRNDVMRQQQQHNQPQHLQPQQYQQQDGSQMYEQQIGNEGMNLNRKSIMVRNI